MDAICAIIVTYNPDEKLICNVEAVSKQVSQVFIIDNGSNIESKHFIDTVKNNYPVTVHEFENNFGLAAGLNHGVRFAKKSGCFWCLLLDQDSILREDYIKHMEYIYENYIEKELVAGIVPTYDTNKDKFFKDNDYSYTEVNVAYTSGSLVKTSAFDSVGLFDESLFVDYVDFDFYLRARLHNYRILKAKKAILNHSVGTPKRRSILGFSLYSDDHNPQRKYLNARNRILVCRRYFRDFPVWCLRDIIVFAKEIIKMLLVEDNKIKKTFEVMRGICHGFVRM